MYTVCALLFRRLLLRKHLNRYRYDFTAVCPNNSEIISYSLVIDTGRVIFVEDIQAACAKHPTGYHEVIADALVAQLGGAQVLTAVHDNCRIRTWRTAR